jgi:VLRF1 release factor-like protein
VIKTVYVAAGRVQRWMAGFGERHPGVRTTVHADRVELDAPDGSSATLYPAFEPLTDPAAGLPEVPGLRGVAALEPDEPTPAQAAAALVANAHSVPVLRALMIRRGGYACAVLTEDQVTASKVGSRYVQGRTAAGGWSQQRFARRRSGQVHGLVGTATEVAVRVLLPGIGDDALITGGDRPLIDRVLTDPRLQPLLRLRRGLHLEIGDPKFDLVKELPERGRAIRIALDEH